MIVLPTWWLVRGGAVPAVCRRHGRAPVKRVAVDVESSPAGWSYALLLAGLLPFAIARAVSRRAVRVPSWPFCGRCRRDRRVVVAASAALMVGGGVVFVSGFGFAYEDLEWSRSIVGLIVMLAGYGLLHWARSSVIAGLRLTRDGQGVEIRRPSAGFGAGLREATGVPVR